MANWNFPSSPTVGQIYTFEDKSWKWDGVAWTLQSMSDTVVTYVEDSLEEMNQMLPYEGATPPTGTLKPGQMWLNITDGRKYTWVVDADSAQWVEIDAALLVTDVAATEQLRSDLESNTGSDIIGYSLKNITGSVSNSLNTFLRGYVNIYNFMTEEEILAAINRTGEIDHTTSLFTAINAAKNYGFKLWIPSGLYIRKYQLGTAVTLENNQILHIVGDGSGLTVIKDKDGSVAEGGSFTRTLDIRVAENANASFYISGITFNKNGASNGNPPTSFAWQQAHCLSITVPATGIMENLIINDIETLDKVGGGIVLTSGVVKKADIKNVSGRNFSGLFGARGDLEFQSTIELFTVENCTGDYCQSEPNTTTPLLNISPQQYFKNCFYGTIEFSGYSSAPDQQTIYLNGVKTTNKATFRNCKVIGSNGNVLVVGSGNAEYWTRCAYGSLIRDSEIIIKIDTSTNTFSPLYLRSEPSGGGLYMKFLNCKFLPSSNVNSSTTGFAVANLATYSGAQTYNVYFENCDFDSRFERVANAYRNGNLTFTKCNISCKGTAFQIGGETTNYGSLTLEDCNFSGVVGNLFGASAGNTLFSLVFKGSHNYSKFLFNISSGNISNLEACTLNYGKWISNTSPASQGIKGMRVQINAPDAGSPAEYICTTTSSTIATFKITQTVAA